MEDAEDILEEAIEDLEFELTSWKQVLEDTIDKLIDAGHEIVKNDVDSVMQRAIAASGTQVICIIDRLRLLVREELIQIKADLLNEDVPPLIPWICDHDPDSIDYERVMENLDKDFVIWGYNFDPENPPKLYLANEPESKPISTSPTPSSTSQSNMIRQRLLIAPGIDYYEWVDLNSPPRVGIGSHYKIVINLSNLELTPRSFILRLVFDNAGYTYIITQPVKPQNPPPLFTNGSIQFYTYENLNQGKHNTGIPIEEYDCGIVGMWADNGDIDENDREDIMVVRAEHYADNWRINVMFNTENKKNETWKKIVLMCLKKEHEGVGYILLKGQQVEGKSQITKISSQDYYCGIVGMAVRNGDIEEDDVRHEILVAYLKDENNQWTIKTNFATMAGYAETWNIDILCVARDEEILLTPQPFDDLNQFEDRETNISIMEYSCGIIGMQARNGDINENDAVEIIKSLVVPNNLTGKWSIQTNFSTHNNHEDWTVNILCPRNTIAVYSEQPWNP